MKECAGNQGVISGTIIINHQPPAIEFDQISDPARGSYFIE
jgi:hypothetical protein